MYIVNYIYIQLMRVNSLVQLIQCKTTARHSAVRSRIGSMWLTVHGAVAEMLTGRFTSSDFYRPVYIMTKTAVDAKLQSETIFNQCMTVSRPSHFRRVIFGPSKWRVWRESVRDIGGKPIQPPNRKQVSSRFGRYITAHGPTMTHLVNSARDIFSPLGKA